MRPKTFQYFVQMYLKDDVSFVTLTIIFIFSILHLVSFHCTCHNVKWMGIKVTSYLYVGKILLWTHCSTLYIDDKKMKHQRHQVIVNRWFVMGAIHEMMMFNILFWFRESGQRSIYWFFNFIKELSFQF